MKPAPPSVSVAMCTYNGAAYLAQQLRSITEQSVPPLEIIVADDGSTDGTTEIIREAQTRSQVPITILEGGTPRFGIKANFERSMRACGGDFIALADQDDMWEPDRLARMLPLAFDNGNAAPRLIYENPQLINHRGEPIGQSFWELASVRPRSPIWKNLLLGNFIPGCTMLFPRRFLPNLLPLPAEAILHDWWIALMFALHGELQLLAPPRMSYRLHDTNAQGIGDRQRALAVLRSRRLRPVAAGNYAAAHLQASAVQRRLVDRGLSYPSEFDTFLSVVRNPAVLRPLALLRLRVTRGNAWKTARSLAASVLVDDELLRNQSDTRYE